MNKIILLHIERSLFRWLGHLVWMLPGFFLGKCSGHVPLGQAPEKTQDRLAW